MEDLDNTVELVKMKGLSFKFQSWMNAAIQKVKDTIASHTWRKEYQIDTQDEIIDYAEDFEPPQAQEAPEPTQDKKKRTTFEIK